MAQKKNKGQKNGSLTVGGKYINETPIHITEIRLHSLMEKTYEKAVKDNEKKNYHCGAFWSITITLLLAWLPLVIKPDKAQWELIYMIVVSAADKLSFVIAIILTVLKSLHRKKQLLNMPEMRDNAIREIIGKENFAKESE